MRKINMTLSRAAKFSTLILIAAIAIAGCTPKSPEMKSSQSYAPDRPGQIVYNESCAVCHSTQFLPKVLKFGDKGDWAKLIGEGQQFPSAHGYVGTRQMPPRGGDPKISLNEFINAVAYMGNAAGADWKESDKLDPKMKAEIEKEISIRKARNKHNDEIGKRY